MSQSAPTDNSTRPKPAIRRSRAAAEAGKPTALLWEAIYRHRPLLHAAAGTALAVPACPTLIRAVYFFRSANLRANPQDEVGSKSSWSRELQ